MVRVIYRFRVQPGKEKVFEESWKQITESIKVKCTGSKGSTLLRSVDDPRIFLGLARWESREAWQRMRQSDIPNMEETERMMEVAENLSIEIAEEKLYLET